METYLRFSVKVWVTTNDVTASVRQAFSIIGVLKCAFTSNLVNELRERVINLKMFSGKS